jgi:hypothetical protein
MPGKIAKQLYVALVDELLPKLQGPEKKGELMGPVVSTMGAETLEGEDVPVRSRTLVLDIEMENISSQQG